MWYAIMVLTKRKLVKDGCLKTVWRRRY